MYHRFHAPADGRLEGIRYISGDTWNVNPVALKVVERLYCRNERVVISQRLVDGMTIAWVAVAAVLVGAIRLHGIGETLDRNYRGPRRIDINRPVCKGEEVGWFELGLTDVLLVPPGFVPCDGIESGQLIRMGQGLLQREGRGPTGSGVHQSDTES